ncbi:uncharacterized protein LOC115985047 [Quercus lobata]|uniref:uncharacterized protein LOC115985047 n=1 Tax=Quercus lobata TaxID=97700 RepID=UPI0012471C86|nr:uncharacterized protein LOC115985047 [Quercus lobata]
MAEERIPKLEVSLEAPLHERTDSPFTTSINGHPLPSKFKLPSLDSYDGTRDPFDHIATFKTTMHLQGVPDEIMCRAFPTTLKGSARVWFSKIPPNSVSSFEELSKLFVNNFIGGQRYKRSSSNLLTIEQGENESLRSFITRFNREALSVDEADDKLLLAAFHNGRKRSERMDANPSRHHEQGTRPKKGWTEERRDRESKKPGPSVWNQQYTPLNAPLEQVLMQIKDDPSLKWPEKMKGDPNKRNRNKEVEGFPWTRPEGRETEGKDGRIIATTTRRDKSHHWGKFNWPVVQVQESILEGSTERPAFWTITKSKVYGRVDKTFTDEDADRIHHPHDDALVISLLIANYTTRRVLVDNGSSADILYYPAFQQMRLGRDQLRPVNSPLVGFGGIKVQPVGTISLSVVVRAYPRQITKDVNFLVVDCPSSYNAIIGRPTLNSWKAVTSTYHLSVKFPIKHGVGQVQGDQLAARECYLAMLAMDEQVQAMNIEEKKVVVEPTEALEDIFLG